MPVIGCVATRVLNRVKRRLLAVGLSLWVRRKAENSDRKRIIGGVIRSDIVWLRCVSIGAWR